MSPSDMGATSRGVLGSESGLAEASISARFDHIAVAAPRVRDLLPLWVDTLGGTFCYGVDNPHAGWRLIRLAFADQPAVELMEPLAGSRFFDTFFARNPAGGLHHVTFLVDELQSTHDHFVSQGFEPFGLRASDEEWQEFFVHPRLAHGVLLQLARRKSAMPLGSSHTIEDVLSGHGYGGTGVTSP